MPAHYTFTREGQGLGVIYISSRRVCVCQSRYLSLAVCFYFCTQFVEEACRRQKAMIPMCTATITELSKDENPAVLSKVMRATGVLFRKALIAICGDDGDVAEDDQADMWEAVREAALTLRAHSAHEHAHVRNSSVMLLQVLANTLAVREDAESEDAEGEEGGEEGFSLHSIPPCHQFLDYSELKKFGQECVQQLLELLNADKGAPWQTVTVAINCLGRVARQNPHLIGTIEPVLTSTCGNSFGEALGLVKWEAASIRSTVCCSIFQCVAVFCIALHCVGLVKREHLCPCLFACIYVHWCQCRRKCKCTCQCPCPCLCLYLCVFPN